MWIIQYRRFFYAFSGLLFAACLGSIFFFGLRLGIEFTGGTLIDVSYPTPRPERAQLEAVLEPLSLGVYSLRPAGDDRYMLRTRDLSEAEKAAVVEALSIGDTVTLADVRTTTIGPVIGGELRSKALIAISLVILMVVTYVAIAFRKVSKPVSSLWYGLITIAALLHDVLVPAGVFALFGFLFGFEVDVLFMTAMLTILGYSVSDTVVVFDRVRENLKRNIDTAREQTFADVVGDSLRQTFTRSFNSSFTTFLAVTALFFLGADSTREFALALLIGVVAGTYSSLFIASPLLVTVEAWNRARSKGEDTVS
jgi:preprotein translocase subunit SecF